MLGSPPKDKLCHHTPKQPKFSKLHPRARAYIDDLLNGKSKVITATLIRNKLLSEIHLKVSKELIQQYLSCHLGLSYKRVKRISRRHNLEVSKLQRQYAAYQFINQLHSGKTIINIDESLIDETDFRNRGWSKIG